jgi:hypothetical protein
MEGEMVDIKEELEQLIERIATHRLRLRGQSERPPLKFEKGEAGGAQAILAAQRRAAASSTAIGSRTTEEAPQPKKTIHASVKMKPTKI